MRDPYPIHGRRWSIWHPFGFSCRCGLNAYPCLVEQTWNMFRGDSANDRPTPWDGEVPVRPWRRARW